MYLKNLSVSPISSFLDSEFLQTVFTGLHMRKDFRNLIGHFCKSRSAQRGVLFWKAAAFFQDMYWNIRGESAKPFETLRQCAKPASWEHIIEVYKLCTCILAPPKLTCILQVVSCVASANATLGSLDISTVRGIHYSWKQIIQVWFGAQPSRCRSILPCCVRRYIELKRVQPPECDAWSQFRA